jgi:hypothetical protein
MLCAVTTRRLAGFQLGLGGGGAEVVQGCVGCGGRQQAAGCRFLDVMTAADEFCRAPLG